MALNTHSQKDCGDDEAFQVQQSADDSSGIRILNLACTHLAVRKTALECENIQLKNELSEIHCSLSWKIGHGIVCFTKVLVPDGSRRGLCIRVLYQFLRHPGVFFRALSGPNITRFFQMAANGDVYALQAIMADRIDGVKTQEIPVQCPGHEPLDMVMDYLKGKEDYSVLTIPYWEHPQVSIVISVSHSFAHLYSCVTAILQNSTEVSFEILAVVDAAAELAEKIKTYLPGVHCIAPEGECRNGILWGSAARCAEGTHLLYLRDDTQVQKNWLAPQLDLMERIHGIGLVVPKCLNPAGAIQEAAEILAGRGIPVGENSLDPSLPAFNYVRKVEYISGVSVLVSRDAAVALAAGASDLRVMYQPLSGVVSFAGADLSERLHPLEQAEKPEHSTGQKTILVVDRFVPTFDRDAGSRTVYQYLKFFADMGFQVKFLGDDFLCQEPYTGCLQQLGIEVLYGPEYRDGWKDWIRDPQTHLDYVLLNRPDITARYIDFLRENTQAKILYYGHDLGFLRGLREADVLGDETLRAQALELLPYELELMRKADMAYYPSEIEVREVHKLDPEILVKAIPAYLFEDVDWEGYDFAARKDIMFIGGFLHRPNVDAVKWLADEIMPELVRLVPDVKVHVLGSHVPKELLDLASPNLIMEGFVTDEQLRQFYASSRISLVPLRYGAGIKGKVIEAMRYGTPVVTTSVGAEGIESAGEALLIENDGRMLAQKLAALYQNEVRLTDMSCLGVEFVRKNYSARKAKSILEADVDFA